MILFGSITTEMSLHFDLYFSDRSSDNNLDYDCLNYYVRDDIVNYHEPNTLTTQIIPYCIRSYDENHVRNCSTNRGIPFTFQELRMRGVTSEQMLTWPSAPIDLIEQYQTYLNNPNMASSLQIFYNCSSPYFGEFCQYTFDTNNSFSEIVRMTFLEKSQVDDDPLEVRSHTCYTHLQCDRGPMPSCLDYREVCDGKIDCKDGQDEEFCFELESNECNKNEYRCHNGLCIPNSFFQDDRLNPECSDRSDEIPLAHAEHYSHSCSRDPAFRCEETTCLDTRYIACGDGQCNDHGICDNRRDVLLNQAIFLSNYDSISLLCSYAMFCVTENDDFFQIDDLCSFCENSNDTDCAEIIRMNCPSIFRFPQTSILFGHVYFIYQNTNSHVNETWIPEYVCYNELLCDFLPPTVTISGMTCRRFDDLGLQTIFKNWHDMLTAVRDLFRTCSIRIESKDCRDSSTLFQCGNNSSKCISQHRLVDGTIDCHDGIDERYKFSCALSNSHHRFQCSSESTCIASHLVQDGIRHCIDGEDEDNASTNQISFSTLCDGVLEQISGGDPGETDCEYFPCSTEYTRCNGYWTCADGADEANCAGSLCPPYHHMCVSITNHKLMCLPLARANDGIVDCLGGFDERHYCQTIYPLQSDRRFRCLNSTECISVHSLCDSLIDCPFGDDEMEELCNNHVPCDSVTQHNTTSISQLYCHLQDRNTQKKYVSLVSSTIVHNTVLKKTSKFKSNTNAISLSQRSVWICNRGILVYMGEKKEEKCLCPPSYYGEKCQYQNQRVSITMKLRSVELRSSFALMLTLIDEENRINSREQITYQPNYDCDRKFNLYLLFASRPKVASKKYSVRIDAFEKNTLEYRSSWSYPILFPFLPVYRLAIDITIPANRSEVQLNSCPLDCQHGRCARFENAPQDFFCRCDVGWFGPRCTLNYECNCSPDSLCLGSINNRSLCVCPPSKFGPLCLLTHSVCQMDTCKNGGQCIAVNEHNFTCICQNGFYGSMCEKISTNITLFFSNNMTIMQPILVHFITVVQDAAPYRTTFIKRNICNQKSVSFFMEHPFNLVFTGFHNRYYLNFIQESYTPSTRIAINITPSNSCPPIQELFNSSILSFPYIRRIKYYHIPCQEQPRLSCFFDEIHMCLCTHDRQANCFSFDHNMVHNCENANDCQRMVRCLDDDVFCSTATSTARIM